MVLISTPISAVLSYHTAELSIVTVVCDFPPQKKLVIQRTFELSRCKDEEAGGARKMESKWACFSVRPDQNKVVLHRSIILVIIIAQ